MRRSSRFLSLVLSVDCLVQIQYDSFCFMLLYFILSCFYLLEACSFLIRDSKGVDLEGRGSREELGVV